MKCGETPFEGESLVKILWDSLCITVLMENVEYIWVNIWCMLDWIVGFCHKTEEIHFKYS